MKYKGNGLNPPKNFRKIVHKKSCGNCEYYFYHSQFSTCKRVTRINIKQLSGFVFVEWKNRCKYVCDGWKGIKYIKDLYKNRHEKHRRIR